MRRVLATLRSLYAEILKFGAVGAVGVGADVATSNALWKLTGLTPTVASVCGTLVATVTAYLGNRYWTFRHRPEADRRREMLNFLLISLIGLVLENAPVFLTGHLLGWHGLMANNVAKFGLGLPLAGAFRFWMCHVFVFPETERRPAEAVGDKTGDGGDSGGDGDRSRGVADLTV